MAFATINSDLSYWQKQVKPLFNDLIWNIPEQRTGQINIIGGNSQSFHPIIRIGEFLNQTFPLRNVQILLPDALRGQLPPIANINFAPSTNSGSLDKSPQLAEMFDSGDFIIVAGDLSKNSSTAIAISDAITTNLKHSETQTKPLLITRDSIDLLTESFNSILTHPQLFIVASMLQLQKIFRATYYPKMIMLSQPLIPIIETLHKFTLTYPATILTFHENTIIIANNGNIVTTPIANTDYSPISLWSGQLAAKVAALNLYNPQKPLEATTAAVLFR